MRVPSLDDPKFMEAFKGAVDAGKTLEFLETCTRAVSRDNRTRAAKQHAIDAAEKRRKLYAARGIALD